MASARKQHYLPWTIAMACLLLEGCMRDDKVEEVEKNLLSANSKLSQMQGQLTQLQNEFSQLKTKVVILEAQQTSPQGEHEQKKITPEQIDSLNVAIRRCVQEVRKKQPNNDFFGNFDAYFNEASGRVENNVIYRGQQPAQFEFNKCMSAQGWHLT